MELSIAELFLAYRQAKISLQQEQQSPWKIRWAEAEQTLPERLPRLREHLRRTPGWFSGLPLGQVWLLPKKATPRRTATGLARIGGHYRVPLASLTVRPHLTPSVEFSTVEVLWLWHFGAALETILGPDALGNRLRLLNHRKDFHKDGAGCFEFWPTAYRAFRENGFEAARAMLKRRRGRCLVATFDLASYYDEIDPSFLTSHDFVGRIVRNATGRGIAFDRVEYLRATTTLLKSLERYRRTCFRLTGVVTRRGIPIGCLTSKLIANLALAPVDDHVRARIGVKYYARYVDDIFLVAEPPMRTPSTAKGIARLFLPVAGSADGELVLDADGLERKGSRFRLQPSKLKAHLLIGRRGRDFLDTIERDVRLIASERRAFLLPDGLGSESPLTALFVGTDSEAPVQVLRDADRLKIERYAASVAISKAAVGVELIDPPELAEWCRRQLAPLAAHMTSPDQWLEFLDLSLRALTVCIRASDTDTARSIVRRHAVHLARFGLAQGTSRATWNGKAIRWQTVRRAITSWYESRRLEEIASAIPLATIGARQGDRFLRQVLGRDLRVGERTFGAEAIARRAVSLRAADLRAVDRETDLQRGNGRLAVLGGLEPRTGRLSGLLRRAAATQARAAGVAAFLDACRESGDHTYHGASVAGLLLMTRPPNQFDVAWRWAKSGRDLDSLSEVTNAVRGTRYAAAAVRRRDAQTIDVTTLDWHLQGKPEDVLVVLGNLQTESVWWASAAKGTPIVSRARMAAIGRIVNEAVRLKRRRKGATLLVLPELSLPRNLLRPLAHRLVQEDISFIGGLEYQWGPTGVTNEAVGVFAPGFKAAAVWWWPKSLPARGELRALIKLNIPFIEHRTPPQVVSTDFGSVSVLICSELLDVRSRGHLLGRIDLLVVPAWNTDTATFDHTLQTTANDLHCYAAVANNAEYSDCRVQSPSDKRHERDACRLISRKESTVIAVLVSANTLREFQLTSLVNPSADPSGFKPLPPGYEFRRL